MAASAGGSKNQGPAGSKTGPKTGSKTTSRATSRTSGAPKKPATIDLDAKEIKEVTPPANAAKSATAKKTASTQDAAKTTTDKPAASSAPKTAAPKANPTPKPDAAKTEATGVGDFGRLLAAGVVGGVITLIGLGALQFSGLIGGSDNNSASDQDIQNLVTSEEFSPLQAEIATLQSKLSELENQASPSVDLSPVENRLAALEQSGSASLEGTAALSKLASELEALKGQLDGLKTSASQLTSDVTSRLDAFGQPGNPSSVDEASTRMMIDEAVKKALGASEELSGEASEKINELENRYSMLESRFNEEVEARIDKFDEQLKNAATGEKLAKAVAINALKSAVANGEPFSSALTSLETLSGPSQEIELLKPYASTGIDTTKSLLSEFQQLQSSILIAATSNPDAGLTDRMMVSLRSLVTISSDKARTGDKPEAIISRIYTNLKSGNGAQALVEWQSLPKPAQQVSNTWGETLGRRIDTEKQLSDLIKVLSASADNAAADNNAESTTQ